MTPNDKAWHQIEMEMRRVLRAAQKHGKDRAEAAAKRETIPAIKIEAMAESIRMQAEELAGQMVGQALDRLHELNKRTKIICLKPCTTEDCTC